MALGGNGAFSRVVINALLADVGWNLADGRSVRYEYVLANGTRADYVLSIVTAPRLLLSKPSASV